MATDGKLVPTENKEPRSFVDRWKIVYQRALEQLWEDVKKWSEVEEERQKTLKDPSMIAAHTNLQTNWIKQSAVDRIDRYYQDLRNTIARKEILRRAPEGALYWAVDMNGVTICSHYPDGLQAAYGPEVVLRFYVDIDTYLSVEPPRLPKVEPV
ncbi:hypothetical protein OEA41_005479 [Lepraria neglecta]|uniref:Uncharacterized protein n=1 Tax=Lepraria neglecta TaxID=209136 RepID=A0AAE0DGQ8_9LECA|nr:hypothetical protein OEA41_005479 [Lepraria neglecta]